MTAAVLSGTRVLLLISRLETPYTPGAVRNHISPSAARLTYVLVPFLLVIVLLYNSTSQEG